MTDVKEAYPPNSKSTKGVAGVEVKSTPGAKRPAPTKAPAATHQGTKAPKEKVVKQIVSVPATKKKKSLGKKFSETFLAEDSKSVGQYIFGDVLIPALKDTIVNMVTGGIEAMFYGQGVGGSRGRGRAGVSNYRPNGGAYTNYNRVSQAPAERPGAHISRAGRSRHNFDEIVLANRGEAEEVLYALVELANEYEMASVADFYRLVGVIGEHTDNKWGWDDPALLARTTPRRINGGGYILDLPRPIPLD